MIIHNEIKQKSFLTKLWLQWFTINYSIWSFTSRLNHKNKFIWAISKETLRKFFIN